MSREYDQPMVDIVEYVYHYSIHDDAAFAAARMALLDALGCAIETVSKSEACRRMLGPIIPGTTTPDGCRVPGTDHELDPVKGAFDLGTLIRYLDHNDALGGAEWGHPSDNLGAILSVADWICRSEASGKSVRSRGPEMNLRTILEALIKAYEIQGCYQMRNAFNAHGMDHVVLVKLAIAAVVSWLMGLCEEQAKAVLSHAWMDGAPTRVYRSGADTVPRKGWAAGDAGSRAVFLAFLVKSGQAGSPGALTAKRWGFLNLHKFGAGAESAFELPKPFGSWVVKNIFFKVMPVEGHGISGVEAALIQRRRLLAEGSGPIEDIAQTIRNITVRTTAAAHLIINKQGPLTNPADRDHCIQYCIALALLKGSYPQATDYQDDSPHATSPILEALRAKIDIVSDATLTQDYLDINIRSVGAGMTIFLNDGRKLDEILVEFPPGHAGNERTKVLQDEKFRRNMGLMFDGREVEAIRRAVGEETRSASELMDLLVRTTGPASARL